jgi:membrane protein involved in colicin uptake
VKGVKGVKGVGGRPLKSKKLVESGVESGGDGDVFEQLLSMGISEERKFEAASVVQEKCLLKQSTETEKIIAAAEKLEKDTEKLAAATEKLAASNAKSAAKAAEKEAKEAAKLAKSAEKEAAVKAKDDAIKAKDDAKIAKESAKLAKEAAALQAKEDAKLAKEEVVKAKEAAKAEKEAAKLVKEAAKAEKEVEPKNADEGSNGTVEALPVAPIIAPLAALNQGSPVAEEGSNVNQGSPAVRVKKFSFEGVKYLKDPAGTIYDLASQDRIGVWNEEEKKIVFDAKGDEEDECSEEDYEDADE